MSINAIIESVEALLDGSVKIALGPYNDDPVGQGSLIITNPPLGVDMGAIVGTHIWGGGNTIMVGEKLWATRDGYVRIKLVDK